MLSIEGVIELLKDKGRKLPKFIYKWRDVYYRMSLHIDGICPIFTADVNGLETAIYRNDFYLDYWDRNYQYLFDAFIFSKYPLEPARTRNWRYAVYKPFTQDPFQRSIQSITGALFQDSGYQLTIDNKSDNDYIWGDNFEGKDLISYVSEKFQNICNDPNSIFLVIPKEPYYATNTKEIEPKICHIPTRDMILWDDDQIIFKYEDYHWLVNKIGYFRFIEVEDGEYIHVDEKQGGYYAHMMGKIPIVIAGGLWNTKGFYESWLKAARPVADEYIASMSDEQMVMKQASFPFITFASTDCPDCEGAGKQQQCTSCHSYRCSCDADHTNGANLEIIPCSKCGGSGQTSINPGDVMIAPPEDMGNDLVKITSPNTSVNELHIKRNEGLEQKLNKALHLNYIDQSQSGVAKDKDMETRYQFYLAISNDLFDRVIRKFVRYIIGLRNAVSVNGVLQPLSSNIDTLYTIVKPTQFGIYTSYDLMEEYKLAMESKLPIYQLNKILDDYTDKRFGGDDVLKRKTYLVNAFDPLATMNYADISIVLLNNGATDRDLQYHIQLPLILDELVNEKGDEWFLKATEADIKLAASDKFNAMKPIIPTVQPQIVDVNRLETNDA